MGNLWTPWRLAYILSAKDRGGCVFCDAVSRGDDEAALVVHRGERAFVILNRYPYANGHLMVAPYAHVGRLVDAAPGDLDEVMRLAALSERHLREAYRPDGLNLGMNLGRVAGAGVLDHVHLHVVPRWEGDTNYMTVFNDVRLIPERLEDTLAKLRARFAGA